jgi:hypothetical protein
MEKLFIFAVTSAVTSFSPQRLEPTSRKCVKAPKDKLHKRPADEPPSPA